MTRDGGTRLFFNPWTLLEENTLLKLVEECGTNKWK